MASNLETLVTVFGGSGFLGRNVVRALAKREYRIRVAVRRPELAGHLQPLGRVGQIHAVQANLRYPASVEAAMRDSHVAINLVGTLAESGAQTFDAVQAKGAETVARTAAAAYHKAALRIGKSVGPRGEAARQLPGFVIVTAQRTHFHQPGRAEKDYGVMNPGLLKVPKRVQIFAEDA